MKISPVINIINNSLQKVSFSGNVCRPKENTGDVFQKSGAIANPEDKYKNALPFIVENYNNKITDLSTGEKINCTYFTYPSDSPNTNYARAAYADGKIVGLAEMRLSAFCGPNQKKSWEDSLDMDSEQIVYLATAPGYGGVGKDLVRGAIMDSYLSNKKGRVLLKVWQEALPKRFAKISGDKMNISPVPFYYKLGFRFINNRDHERCIKGMEAYKRTGVYPKSAANIGFMYLKETDALKLLES